MSFVLLCVMLLVPVAAGAEVVFYGQPAKKVTTTHEATDTEALTPESASQLAVTITFQDGKYYWASRSNKPLFRSESGSYITFHAVDGSGYIRVYQPFMYELMAQLPPGQRDREIGYVEHLVHMFGSITYFGHKR